ncbi:helix-turn-helix transcriptional regulator [Lactobacillus reuteri]|uniref:helix-turn-helix domain-containing protein n=1 Tax=Limosilactobacillus reuteri TaxID=1598 RepID=UPI001469CB6D|nr:helix-turn-helix transcriptional regulator [Limosilactobacillus reuteri]NMV51909.1 helix-turn-helix transcriptional regulator [Limosilactobacillus reuteri]
MDMGDRIAELRSNAHMSQFQLAKVLGIGTSTLGMYETNKRKPSPKVLKHIADYFNVSTDYLLGRSNNEKEKKGLSLDEAVDSVMSFNGRPVTDHDRQMMKSLWKSYLENKD